jgi:transcriptional regulator with XRE-family HTH domain
MQIGAKLRELRIAKNLSQGDIEKRTGLFRCYTSRVEHGHTVPSVETLEKYAHALEIPLYRLFTDDDSVKVAKLPKSDSGTLWGHPWQGARRISDLARALAQMNDQQRRLLLTMAQRMAGRNRS